MFQRFIFSLTILIGLYFLPTYFVTAQNQVHETFLTTRLINTHTVLTVPKRKLDIRITHRFDDIAGSSGGIGTLFGLDNVTDIRIALEYGVTDKLTLGFGRSKGSFGPKQLLDGYAKYAILQQTTDKKMPISLTVLGSVALSTMTATEDPTLVTSFDNFAHRLSYQVQALVAHKLSDRISLQLMPTYLHRNFVLNGDENDLFALGIGARIAISKHLALIFDYYQYFSSYRNNVNSAAEEGDLKFYPPIGIGLEIKTGGHVFHLNFSNSTGIIEQQYIPYTTRNWLDGEFRLGFNISRLVKL